MVKLTTLLCSFQGLMVWVVTEKIDDPPSWKEGDLYFTPRGETIPIPLPAQYISIAREHPWEICDLLEFL